VHRVVPLHLAGAGGLEALAGAAMRLGLGHGGTPSKEPLIIGSPNIKAFVRKLLVLKV
jgi:hypothetical protein